MCELLTKIHQNLSFIYDLWVISGFYQKLHVHIHILIHRIIHILLVIIRKNCYYKSIKSVCEFMWKKTIETIKRYPKMLWGFTVPVVINLMLLFPIYRSIVLTILGSYSRIDDVPNFAETVRSYVFALPIAYILMGVFVLPALYGGVYTAVTGIKRDMRTKEWFFKYSWRVVVKGFFGLFVLFSVFVLFFLFFVFPNVGFTLYTVGFSAWGVFWMISLTSVIAEDKFIDSFPNTFFVGGRYYLKMYFTTVTVMLPAIVLSTLYMIHLHKVGLDIAYAVPQFNIAPEIIAAVFILIVVLLSIYYVYANAFLFTYSMQNYIKEKDKLEMEEKEKENNAD